MLAQRLLQSYLFVIFALTLRWLPNVEMKSTFCFLYSYPWIICPGNESSVVPTQGFPHWWPLTTTRCNYPAAARQSGNYLTIFFSQQGTRWLGSNLVKFLFGWREASFWKGSSFCDVQVGGVFCDILYFVVCSITKTKQLVFVAINFWQKWACFPSPWHCPCKLTKSDELQEILQHD